MSGRQALPRMRWDEASPTDLSGVVLWWSRVAGNRLAEVHHLRAYQGRLRCWEARGHGQLVLDEPVRITRDGRNGPEANDVEHWQSLLRDLTNDSPGEPS